MSASDAATGMKLAQAGRFAEALPYLDRANRTAPADVPLLHAVASLLQASGRPAEAVERYRIAAAALPADVGVLTGWARALLLLGERRQALPLIVQALGLDPGYADPGGMLEKLWETGDADEASQMLHALVEAYPLDASLMQQYAETLQEAEHLDAARIAFERYRVLRPHDPVPCVELGRLAINRGEPREALEHFRAALRIDPENIRALHELAMAEDGGLDPHALELTLALAQSAKTDRESVALDIALTRHYDRVGDYQAAATHAARANASRQELASPQKRYSEQQHRYEVDQVIQSNTPQIFDRLRNAGSPERRPVFVIGLPRSGTTLLEQMLASHPSVIGVGEQPLAPASLKRALALSGPGQSLTARGVADAAAWHLSMLDNRVARLAIQREGERIVDKLPDNYLFAGWLRIAFPNAAIIHCLRDPRDVALSCWLTQFAEIYWNCDLDFIAHRIEQHRRLLCHWRATIGDHLTEIRYERLVANPESELRRALAAMHLDWHPDVLSFTERKSFVASASRHQVRQQLNTRSIARWRKYEHALQPILPRLDAMAAQDDIDFATSG